MRPAGAWIAAWPGGAVIGVLNGVLRETTYGRRVSELRAHQVSSATAIAAFAGYFAALERRHPLPTRREAVLVGGAWTALTIAFEVGFGRAVAHQTWSELGADYDLRRGRTWPLVLAWLALGPLAVRSRAAAITT